MTSDDEPISPKLKTSVDERHYGTIPGSALATQAALSHSQAHANPTVERGPSCTKRVKSCQKNELLISPHKLITKRNKTK